MYEENIEIMVPSNLNLTKSFLTSQYNWMSDDRKVTINFTKGGSDLDEEGLLLRLDEYYRGFSKDISGFECLNIEKRRINGRYYGEIRYNSEMTGYHFFNIFVLGFWEGAEIILTLQCMENDKKSNLHVFDNISDSIRVIRKSIKTGEKEYDN